MAKHKRASKELQDDDGIECQEENPKRPGSQSYDRYAKYCKAKTVKEFYAHGGSRKDLMNDMSKGFLRRVQEAKEVKKRKVEEKDDLVLNETEVRHMLQFYLCQMRWQYGCIVNPGDFGGFDDAILRLSGESCVDLASNQVLMDAFFKGPARGDKWVPWHCATCEQELFLMQEVRTRNDFSEKARFAMCTSFSASRVVPMWRQVVLPALAEDPERIVDDPDSLFRPGGRAHQAIVEWRTEGNLLHTTAFNCYPPPGAKGDQFTDYIAKRHAMFADLGSRAFTLLQEASKKHIDMMHLLDTHFQSMHKVGPTMSKVLLVTTHLWYPELHILDEACLVGDGAALAFDFLYSKSIKTNRAKRLDHLYHFMQTHLDTLEPRFRPMLKFLAEETRKKFPQIPQPSLPDTLTIYDLQVQLCEWRKFRKNVDKHRKLSKRSPLTPFPSDPSSSFLSE